MSLSCPCLRPYWLLPWRIYLVFSRDVRWFSPIFFYVPPQERCAIMDSHSFLFTAFLQNVSLCITLSNLWSANQTHKHRLPTFLFAFTIFFWVYTKFNLPRYDSTYTWPFCFHFPKSCFLLKRSVGSMLSIILLHNIYIVSWKIVEYSVP